MSWLFKSTAQRLTVESCVSQALHDHAHSVTPLLDGIPTPVQPLVRLVLERLLVMAWDLPASEVHHHSRPFGLFQHSLEVATAALVAFERTTLWWQYTPELVQRHQMEPYWRVGTALAGLLHDGGKLLDCTVTMDHPDAASPPAVWEPLTQDLLTWLLTFQDNSTLPRPTVTWQPGRGMQHEGAAVLVASLLLPQTVTRALTLPVARSLWDFLRGAEEPTNVFLHLVPGANGADSLSVRSDLRTHEAPPQRLASRVLSALKGACADGTLRVNQFPGQVFVRSHDTLVVMPKALDVLRRPLQAAGVRLPGNEAVYTALADQGWLLGESGQHIQPATFARPNKEPVALTVLCFPNNVLWGNSPPEPFTPPPTLPQENAP
jgi:hypothetical protein